MKNNIDNSPPTDDFIYGRNPVLSLLEAGGKNCMKVIMSKTVKEPFRSKLREACRACGVVLQETDPQAFDRLLGDTPNQGVAARVSGSDVLDMAGALDIIPPPPQPALVVVLDHLEDPHNCGAVIRTAEAAGACCVMMPAVRGALPGGTLAKSSAGASLRLPVCIIGNVANALRTLQEEANFWAVGLEASGDASLMGSKLSARTALVVGSEGKGLGRTTSAACDELVSIPMSGQVGSLNASVAAALGIYEWFRQHR